MSVDRRIRCECVVLVVAHAIHAYGMVHATAGGERLPTRICAAVWTDGCEMVDLGIRTLGTRHTTSDQQSREENRQTFGGRVVQRDEHGASVQWMCFSWSPVHRSTRLTPSIGNTWLNCSPKPERTPHTYVTLSRSSSCWNAS